MNIEDIFIKYNCKPIGIIHIGAHMCEEQSIYLKYVKSNDQIIWLEGNPQTYEKAKIKNPDVNIYNALISNEETYVNFIVTNNICSSSILPLKEHITIHPEVLELKRQKLKTITFEQFVIENNIDMNMYDLLVMDIQGAELMALKGMTNLLDKFKYIFLEVSLVELYEGYCLFDDMIKFLNNYNFCLKAYEINKYQWGDAFFVKNGS